MKRIVWFTDVHLNHIERRDAESFVRSVAVQRPDVAIAAGDIGESDSTIEFLLMLDRVLQIDLYFVLGNHDFYRSSIETVREEIRLFSRRHSRVHWLSDAGVVEMTPTVGLIGVESWADGGNGDYAGSEILLADYFLIRELMCIFPDTEPTNPALEIFSPDHEQWLYSESARRKRLPLLRDLGLEGARYVRNLLPGALDRYEHVIFVTHVPPFPEACFHRGAQLDDQWLPHFSCRAVGEALHDVMRYYPDRRLTVLCGHTHGASHIRVAPNIDVITGGAEYGRPEVQEPIEVF